MLQLGNWACAHSLTINYYVTIKTTSRFLKRDFFQLNFSSESETLHRGHPSSSSFVAFPCVLLLAVYIKRILSC